MQSMQHMSSMMNSMNSMFSNPFGMMGQSQLMAPPGQSQNQMMSYGFPMAPFNMNMNMNMNDMYAGFVSKINNNNYYFLYLKSKLTVFSLIF